MVHFLNGKRVDEKQVQVPLQVVIKLIPILKLVDKKSSNPKLLSHNTKFKFMG